MSNAKHTLLIGGSLNDHGAVPTKVSYNKKNVMLKESEGYYVYDGMPIQFKIMSST